MSKCNCHSFEISFIVIIEHFCRPYFYGSNCSTPCGQCKGSAVCDDEFGYCSLGCKPHWIGSRCDGEKKIVKYSKLESTKTRKCSSGLWNIYINALYKLNMIKLNFFLNWNTQNDYMHIVLFCNNILNFCFSFLFISVFYLFYVGAFLFV